MEKGMVLPGYGNLEPVPVPEHTRDHIVMVLPIPVSCLNADVTMKDMSIKVGILMRCGNQELVIWAKSVRVSYPAWRQLWRS